MIYGAIVSAHMLGEVDCIMRRQYLGSSDLHVSVVGLGTWAIGGDFWGETDDAQSIQAIQTALDSGINLIDTAPAYGAGHAETVVGKAIAGRRDEVVIATKCGVVRTKDGFERNLKPESVRQEVEDSLRRLQTDVIDLYQIHWPDVDTPLEDTLAALKDLQQQGKFRYLGVSNFGPELMEQVMREMDLVSLQPQYSLLQRDIEQETLPFCRRHNIGVLSYGSLAAGVLTGKFKERPAFAEGDQRYHFYPFFEEPLWSQAQELVGVLREIAESRGKPTAQAAINWVVQQDGITSALVGCKTPDQARQNAAAGTWTLTDEEWQIIDGAYRRIFSS